MNLIRQFTGWVALNPIRFSGWFLISCFNGLMTAIYDAPFWLCFVTFLVISLLCYCDVKIHKLPLFLCLALAIPARTEPEPQFEPAGMAGVAVVVIVVGGVTIYLLVKTCQRVFPKTSPPGTNSPPYVISGGSPDCAGSWTYAGWVSCYPQANLVGDVPPPAVSLELTGSVEASGELRLSAGRQLRSDELVSPQDFERNLAKHGIRFGVIGEQSFGLWGRPAYPEEVPIAFSEDAFGNKVVTVHSSAPMVDVALERSSDLRQWTRIAQSSVPIGQRMRIVDSTTAGQMFYRLRAL